MPTVSLIVPAYNEQESIGGCIESLLQQTYTDFEITVVDNCSTDGTVEVVRQYPVKVLTEHRRGYHHVVKRGVAHAAGRVFAICDADCRYPSGWLQKSMRHFEDQPAALAVYGPCQFYDHRPFINWISRVWFRFFLRCAVASGFHSTPGPNFIIRVDAYHAVGGYDPVLYDFILTDVELGQRLQRQGPLVLDLTNPVLTSSRRFKKNGLIRTSAEEVEAWFRLRWGRKQRIDYQSYNDAAPK